MRKLFSLVFFFLSLVFLGFQTKPIRFLVTGIAFWRDAKVYEYDSPISSMKALVSGS